MKIILSYPRSGNHLTRFFIELLTEKPTFGCLINPLDIPIYQNKFTTDLPFNININNINNIKDCYYKYHYIPKKDCSNLIFIIRNPKEVLLRHHNYIMDYNIFNKYFDCIDYYINFNGNKILFFYEDIITNKVEFINKLYHFLDCKNNKKLEWIINNIDLLYNESLNGKNRSWGGVNSNSINYYYPKLQDDNKIKFDEYISYKLYPTKYSFIKEKYNI